MEILAIITSANEIIASLIKENSIEMYTLIQNHAYVLGVVAAVGFVLIDFLVTAPFAILTTIGEIAVLSHMFYRIIEIMGVDISITTVILGLGLYIIGILIIRVLWDIIGFFLSKASMEIGMPVFALLTAVVGYYQTMILGVLAIKMLIAVNGL